jgi:single stranded DNA-binding protein
MIHATIIGRLGRDPESRDTQHGAVCSVSVASDHGWGDTKTTTWVKVSAWRGLGETLGKLAKGCRVAASGELYDDKWTDKDDVEHSVWKLDASKLDIIDWPDQVSDSPKAAPKAAPRKPTGPPKVSKTPPTTFDDGELF